MTGVCSTPSSVIQHLSPSSPAAKFLSLAMVGEDVPPCIVKLSIKTTQLDIKHARRSIEYEFRRRGFCINASSTMPNAAIHKGVSSTASTSDPGTTVETAATPASAVIYYSLTPRPVLVRKLCGECGLMYKPLEEYGLYDRYGDYCYPAKPVASSLLTISTSPHT